MKFALPLLSAAAFALAAPALAATDAAQQSSEPAPEQQAEAQTAEPTEAKDETPAAIEVPAITEPEEEKRICRRIRTDMSSRRATRVCKTADEWREFNQRR